jgi:hypothetical protein
MPYVTSVERLACQKVPFDNLRVDIKLIILKNITRRKPDKVLDEITEISIDLANATFDRNDIFSGNLDAKKNTRRGGTKIWIF